jgi:hypothetical protein
MILLKPYKNSEKYTICKILLFGCFVNKKNLLTLHSQSLVFEQPRMLNRGIAESLKRRITIHSGTLIFLLRLGIINAGHFDKLSDRIASALAAQETRQAQ